MTLDDLKERLATEAKNSWDKFQESSVYNNIRDRYENLTPPMQKLAVAGSIILVSAIILSFPYSAFNVASENVNQFEDKRGLLRDMLKVSREASEMPSISEPPTIEALKSLVQTQINNANLIPEQIKSIEATTADSKLIPGNLSSGALIVNLSKLNLRQIIDLGYQLQAINTSVKMQDIQIAANAQEPHYFDVVYKMVSLAVPSSAPAEADEPKTGLGRKGIRGQ